MAKITAHELARQLLAQGDHEVCLLDEGATHGWGVGSVVSCQGRSEDSELTKPMVVIVIGSGLTELHHLPRSV